MEFGLRLLMCFLTAHHELHATIIATMSHAFHWQSANF
jgi:hypothetical protein